MLNSEKATPIFGVAFVYDLLNQLEFDDKTSCTNTITHIVVTRHLFSNVSQPIDDDAGAFDRTNNDYAVLMRQGRMKKEVKENVFYQESISKE